MYYRISKNEKILFFGKKIAQVWAVTLIFETVIQFHIITRTNEEHINWTQDKSLIWVTFRFT